ncbi:RHS repeat-associated core domain-containing protein [Alkalimonas amylolytica]|uniref:RHS repeat-associated core domain-containing protein n=1 Tax=Alkalimonas amylolytica TaxID=152573 RepID=UPI00149586D2|nr:RHS repeat-associated core domain-containing protein [Alkalimonas amylolytica]
MAVTSQAKQVLQQLTYDPWGRQFAVHSHSGLAGYSLPSDSQGYTGHRMVKGFEVVHMGGRTYNPFIGRFMQPDPFIQAPLNMQNYNRYSYVLNNPMSYTDPSGYNFVKKALKGLMEVTGTRKLLRELGRNQYLNALVHIGVCMTGGPVACGAYSGAQSFAMTGSLGAGVRSGLITFGSAWSFQQIGGYYEGVAATEGGAGLYHFGSSMGNNLYLTSGQIAGQITAHAMVGGITASLQGGKFGHGFFSAGVTKGLGTPIMDAHFAQNMVGGTLVSAAIGGTSSAISGGKFANGAVTGAMQALYNQYSRARAETSKPTKDADGWEHELTIIGTGRSSEIDAGRYLKVELDSVTLGADGTHVHITIFPLDENGHMLSTMRRHGPNFAFSSHAGMGYAPSSVFDAGYENRYGFRWLIKVPSHQSPHGNAAGVQVKVYKWGGE